MTPSSGAATIHPFKFRPRREIVDWRRINAVDIDLVVSQLDVDALQEHINTVTFCSLVGERCQRCQSPVDPVLIKLLQLSQLTVEWLLHCQEILTINLQASEERLAAAGRERELLLAQLKKQEDTMKEMTTELKQRKKIIRTQQSLFAPQIINSQKCSHCEKSFINSSFLQSHMQRRHPDEYEIYLDSVSEKKSEMESLKLEISSLKERIVQHQQILQDKTAQSNMQHRYPDEYEMELRSISVKKSEIESLKLEVNSLKEQIVQHQQALRDKTAQQEKEQQSMQKDLQRELDHFKTLEITQRQAIQQLDHQQNKQDKKWESRLQKMKAHHESEKNQLLNELSRLKLSVTEQQESNQRLQQEMGRRLQEKEQTIKAQREQIRNISSNPPTKVVEVPVLVSPPVPDPKPKRVVLEEPVSAPKLDPIQELSEEEKDSSSISERRPMEKKPEPVPEKKQRVVASALRRSPNKKEIRRDLEQAVMKKLVNLGVKPDQRAMKNKEFSSILAKVQSKRESVAKRLPDYWHNREDLESNMERKLGRQRSGSFPAPESPARSRHSVQVLQIRPRSSSLPSRVTQVMSGPSVKQPKTPQPAPRTKTTNPPKTSTPISKTALRAFTSKTPPFSSDEESKEEDTDMEEVKSSKAQRSKTSQSRLNQAATVQTRAGKTSPVQARQAAARHTYSSNAQVSRESSGGVTKTAVTKMESDDDDDEEEEEEEEWSELSELQEIDPRQLQSYKDQNGNVEKRNIVKENKINDLARKMERKIAERVTNKPAGGISILPERKDEVQELSYTDLEESSEWVVSSLEDRQEKSKPGQSSGLMRKSLDSPSTSVWGTSTGKAPKSGLTEAGTGSTLKSSLCSLSDISDSEDMTN
ncbi:cilium assembly protein DZIP1 [Aulostomus maculatus]